MFGVLFAIACGHARARPRAPVGDDDPTLLALANARSGNVLVRCSPPDAEITIDGVPSGLTSDYDGRRRLLALAPGEHRIAVRRQGYAPIEVKTTVAAGGGRQTLDLALPRIQGTDLDGR